MIKICAIATILSFVSNFVSMSSAYGVGIGDLLVESHLDQAFRAQLPLQDIGDLNVDEIKVRLGSAEDFEQAAVDFSDFLANLTFTIVKNAKNDAIIQIKSDLPVQDPYIAFILEISWTTGRLLKEFSVLIDPVELKQMTLPAIAEPLAESVPAPVPVPVPAPVAPNPKPKEPLISVVPTVKKREENKPIVSVHKKPLELLSPTAKPENLTQRLVMIEEMLDTLTQNNKMLKDKQNEYRAENQSLLALLKVKEQEIIRLKMPTPSDKSSKELLIVMFGVIVGLILIVLVFLMRLKKIKK